MPRIEDPPVSLVPSQPAALIPANRANFMYAMMNAVGKDQDSMSKMQLTDSQTTENNVAIENALYQYWNGPNGPLAGALWWINYIADHNATQYATAAQEAYNNLSSIAQANESQEDGAVQASQGQTSTDASNLQMKAQLLQAVNDIQATTGTLINQIIA